MLKIWSFSIACMSSPWQTRPVCINCYLLNGLFPFQRGSNSMLNRYIYGMQPLEFPLICHHESSCIAGSQTHHLQPVSGRCLQLVTKCPKMRAIVIWITGVHVWRFICKINNNTIHYTSRVKTKWVDVLCYYLLYK